MTWIVAAFLAVVILLTSLEVVPLGLVVILVVLYLALQCITVIYTAQFGLQLPENQPLLYRRVRYYLKYAAIFAALSAAFALLYVASPIFPLVIISTPFITEKLLFNYCKRQAINRLTAFYINPNHMGADAMDYASARQTAASIIANDIGRELHF